MIRNAPHLVSHQAFIVPNYEWWDGPFYGAGMKVYDLLAGKLGLGPSKHLSKEETLKRIPTLEPKGLRGGVVYFDGQFDDSRLAINLAQTITEHGGIPINYMKVTGFTRADEMINGVIARDIESGKDYEIHGWLKHFDKNDPLHCYGSDAIYIKELVNADWEKSQVDVYTKLAREYLLA